MRLFKIKVTDTKLIIMKIVKKEKTTTSGCKCGGDCLSDGCKCGGDCFSSACKCGGDC